ncbi:MAG: glycosyltransferase [Nanoarchaeota archaeon]|nr:glycosyltransferase [Nanoarchaeota archaeon]
MEKNFVSIVIPVYNAAKVLEDCVRLVTAEIKPSIKDYEIIIAEDASMDGSTEIATKLAKEDAHIVHIHSDKKQGRGKALTNAFSAARGNIVMYIDADLDISPKYIPLFIEYLKSEYDIVFASKRHPEANAKSPILRKILSISYNRLVRLLFKSKVYCHQGGMKGFKRKAILKILPYVQNNKWFWDTEVLVIAQWMGCQLKEIPVTCDYGFKGTTVSSFKDAYGMFVEAIQFKKRESEIKKQLTKNR